MTEIEEERMWLKCLELERENKRLREGLESIAKGITVNPPNGQVEAVVGYFVGFAEAVLKSKDK